MPTSSAVATARISAGGAPRASFSPPFRRRGIFQRMRPVLALALLAAAPVSAQTLGTPLPLGMDLRKASVGAWSDYTVNVADLPPMKQRFAVVGRDAATHIIEVISEGGPLGPKSRMALRFELEADP